MVTRQGVPAATKPWSSAIATRSALFQVFAASQAAMLTEGQCAGAFVASGIGAFTPAAKESGAARFD